MLQQKSTIVPTVEFYNRDGAFLLICMYKHFFQLCVHIVCIGQTVKHIKLNIAVITCAS